MHIIRPMRLPLLLCTLLPFCAQAVDTPAPPLDRPHSLLNSFDVMCNLEPPNFEHLSAKASAMHLKTMGEDTQTTPTGETMQTRSWLGMLTTGAFALTIERMSGAKGVATSCAIEGPVPDVAAFREIVASTHHLNATPEKQVVDGSNTYYWDHYTREGWTLMVRDFERPGGHFVQVKLLAMAKAGAPQ